MRASCWRELEFRRALVTEGRLFALHAFFSFAYPSVAANFASERGLILQLPAILSTSSFDGTVSVYSLTDTGDGVSAGQVHAFALSFPEVRMSMVTALFGVYFE